MTTASSAPTGRRRGMRALGARRAIDVVGLRVAPALTAFLIVWSHLSLGQGLVVFTAVLAAGQLLERSPFPLSLLPAARLALAVVAPLIGVLGAVAAMLALGAEVSVGDMAAAVVGAMLVLILGAWIRFRV